MEEKKEIKEDKEFIISIKNLEDLIKTKKIVFILLSTAWCPPCKKIKPFFKKAIDEEPADSNRSFLLVDVDEYQDVAQHYNITKIPTLHVYINSKLEYDITGISPDKFKELLKLE